MVYKFKYFFFSQLFYKFLNKFSLKGNNYRIELFFENYLYTLKLKKKINFFLIYLESLALLKPEIGVKILKFSRNKNVKRRKKGAKLVLRTKVIPRYINKKAKYNLALKWLVFGIVSLKKDTKYNFNSINKSIFSIIDNKSSLITTEKKKLRKLIIINRGSAHYR